MVAFSRLLGRGGRKRREPRGGSEKGIPMNCATPGVEAFTMPWTSPTVVLTVRVSKAAARPLAWTAKATNTELMRVMIAASCLQTGLHKVRKPLGSERPRPLPVKRKRPNRCYIIIPYSSLDPSRSYHTNTIWAGASIVGRCELGDN